MRRRFPKPSAVSITARSTLIVKGKGDVTIEGLVLDGALEIEVCEAIRCNFASSYGFARDPSFIGVLGVLAAQDVFQPYCMSTGSFY